MGDLRGDWMPSMSDPMECGWPLTLSRGGDARSVEGEDWAVAEEE
jgi:hypothetical protein